MRRSYEKWLLGILAVEKTVRNQRERSSTGFVHLLKCHNNEHAGGLQFHRDNWEWEYFTTIKLHFVYSPAQREISLFHARMQVFLSSLVFCLSSFFFSFFRDIFLFIDRKSRLITFVLRVERAFFFFFHTSHLTKRLDNNRGSRLRAQIRTILFEFWPNFYRCAA